MLIKPGSVNIGKFMNKICILVLFLLVIFPLVAEIQIESYVNKTNIGIQDIIQLTIEVKGEKLYGLKSPEINLPGFRKLGSSTSSGSSMSIMNGKMVRSETKSYIYNISPLKVGKLIIPPSTVKINKDSYTTKPIKITVKENSTSPPETEKQTENNLGRNSTKVNNLFLEIEISKNDYYLNEPIKIDYTLFSRFDIANISYSNEPSFNNFWKEDIFTANSYNFRKVNLNGLIFESMLMRSIALFPSKTGNLQIPSIELIVDVRTQARSFFDRGSTKRSVIKSKPVIVNVKPLPEKGKPAGFSGAVGDFTLTSNISTAELKVGESFTYTLEIRGNGNLNQFDPPVLPEIQHLRFFEPEISTEISDNMISGKKIIKYLVIAQEKGVFNIPSLQFSYFDPILKKYNTKKTKTYTLNIAEGDLTFIPTGISQSKVVLEGRDIGFVLTGIDIKSHSLIFSSFYYWLCWIILLFSFPLVWFYRREQTRLIEDYDYNRMKQANKILRKYMRQATIEAKRQNIDFYTSVQRGLSNFLADKLKQRRGSETDEVISLMYRKNVDENIIQKINNIFSRCDQVRFMPGGSDTDRIQADYDLLKEILSDISRIKV